MQTMQLPGWPKGEAATVILIAVLVLFSFQVFRSVGVTPQMDTRIARSATTFLVPSASPAAHSHAPGIGLAMSPGYPALLAGIASVEREMADDIHCVAAGHSDCRRGYRYRTLITLQLLAGLGALALTFFLASALSGSKDVGALTTLLMLIASDVAELALSIMPYVVALTLTLAFCVCLFLAHERRALSAYAIGGLILGLLSLLHVYYLAIVVLVSTLMIIVDLRSEQPERGSRIRGTGVAAFASGAIALYVAGSFLCASGISFVREWEMTQFAERVAYNDVTVREWFAGFFVWLPGAGALAPAFSPAETLRKFDLYYPGSLLLEAERILSAVRADGAGESVFHGVLKAHVLGDPVRYAATSILLIVRGLRVNGGIIVFAGLLAFPLLLRRLRATRRLGVFMLVASPLIGLTIVQALLTGNLPWMNLPLTFVYSFCIATVTGGLELPIALQRWLDPRGHTRGY